MTLVRIAAIGGIATVTMGFAWRMKINNNVASTHCYKEAMKTLRGNRGAVYLLGEPIKDNMFNVGDTKRNYTKDLLLHYEIPIKGSKQRGTLHYWGERMNKDEEYNLTRMELELKGEPNRRLLIKGTLE